jgi:hypothetical protein
MDNMTLNWETFLPALELATIPATIQQSPQRHLNYSLAKKLGCHHFQMSTFNKFTTVKPLLLNDLTFCKNSELKRTKWPVNMELNLKTILTKIPVRTTLKLVTKCSSQMTFIQEKTQNLHHNSKGLAKLLTLMTLMPK